MQSIVFFSVLRTKKGINEKHIKNIEEIICRNCNGGYNYGNKSFIGYFEKKNKLTMFKLLLLILFKKQNQQKSQLEKKMQKFIK